MALGSRPLSPEDVTTKFIRESQSLLGESLQIEHEEKQNPKSRNMVFRTVDNSRIRDTLAVQKFTDYPVVNQDSMVNLKEAQESVNVPAQVKFRHSFLKNDPSKVQSVKSSMANNSYNAHNASIMTKARTGSR